MLRNISPLLSILIEGMVTGERITFDAMSVFSLLAIAGGVALYVQVATRAPKTIQRIPNAFPCPHHQHDISFSVVQFNALLLLIFMITAPVGMANLAINEDSDMNGFLVAMVRW